jgi:hypothetical protein
MDQYRCELTKKRSSIMTGNKETVSEADVEKVFAAVGPGSKCKFSISFGNTPKIYEGVLVDYTMQQRKFTVMFYNPKEGNYKTEFDMNTLISIAKV